MTGPEVDRTTAVLSIRPVYADRILDGSKTIEFRRKPLPEAVKTALIWRTGKGGGIVGQFTVAIQTGALAKSWDSWVARGAAGINFADLVAYAGGRDQMLWGIRVTGLIVFAEAIPGPDLGTDRPGQSWRYAAADWRDCLAAVL